MGTSSTAAEVFAARLKVQGVTRVYGLCGGHIQPLWDAVDRAGIEIVDVRHEASAVYMAQASSELTGELGVALVTAGPGLTNSVTAIANASVSRSPVLIVSGRPPRPQAGMGAMQDIPQEKVVQSLCQEVEQVSQSHHVLQRLDKVIAASLGQKTGETGPSYIDLPADLWDELIIDDSSSQSAIRKTLPLTICPTDESIDAAARLIRRSSRIVVISGRPTRLAANELTRFLDTTGALYLDSGESRGVIDGENSAYVPAMRGKLMTEADLVITLGRRLDFQLGYGSSAVFSSSTKFLRIGTSISETSENRRGDVEVYGSLGAVLERLSNATARPQRPDVEWYSAMREGDNERKTSLDAKLHDPTLGSDRRMSPYYLIGTINRFLEQGSVVVADGGDILSFARVGLRAVDYLDCGALGCLGVGVPFVTAASLLGRDGPCIAVIGDGSFGFTAMDVDTAVRHRAPAVFVVANNEAWNIERHDQNERYSGNLVGVDLPDTDYAQLGTALGAYSQRIDDPSELNDALYRAIMNAPALVEVMVTSDVKSPDFLSGLASVPARQPLKTWNEQEAARYVSQQ